MRHPLTLAALLLCALGATQQSAEAKSVTSRVADPIKTALFQASDTALDKLAEPGAFQNDPAVRIVLPALVGKTGADVIGLADKLGLADELTKGLNDAAGLAAREAKPIFHNAIDRFRITDAPGVLLKNDGGTRYLKKKAGADLKAKLRPLVLSALGKVGAFGTFDRFGKAAALLGVTKESLTDSVTDQALSGIFSYVGREEMALRQNPLGTARSVLDSVLR